MSTPAGPALLSVRNVVKSFPGTRALDDVSLDLHGGEILALLGQNGSGKSTLVKILAGVYRADAGTVQDRSGSVRFVHQDLGLIDSLSTVENLALGVAGGGLRPLRRRADTARALAAIRGFGVQVDVHQPVGRLTAAEKTVVAIGRAIDDWSASGGVLVLDEPTAALHGDEVEVLFRAVRSIAEQGAGVVFISHRLHEVTDLATRVIVLRDGRVAADTPTAGLTPDDVASLITGLPQGNAAAARSRPPARRSRPVLTARGLRGPGIDGIDLEVWPGEVVGVAGSLGSGREHLAGLLYGAVARTGGTVTVCGADLPAGRPRRSVQAGVAFVPADRRAHAGVMSHSVRENLTLPDLTAVTSARVQLRPKRERAEAVRWTDAVGMHPRLPEREFGLFSGGNQQKAVIARWIRTAPDVLLVDEPTQGVDIAASETVRGLITDTARRGTAVLVASSDHVDLVRMCTRVLVLRDGRCVRSLEGDEITERVLTREALGTRADTDTASTTGAHHV